MRKITVFSTILMTLVWVGFGVGVFSDDEFKPRVVIKRKFPAIKDVKAKTVAEADKVLGADELVLGVAINGQARAYAINMLTGPRREIVNDTLGGMNIAATW